MAELKLISDRPLIVNDSLQLFWKDLWHIDVKKDHGNDYDAENVIPLIPGGGGGLGGGKEGLFKRLILNNSNTIDNAYNIFQNATGLSSNGTLENIPFINVAFTGYEYDYKFFDRPTTPEEFSTVASNINVFLGARTVLRYTDTSRGGKEFLCNYPKDKLYHANTREVESDPASKLSMDSLRSACGDEAAGLYFYEPPTNPTYITYPAWDSANITNNTALGAFYCSKTLIMNLNGADPATGKLKVQLTFYNSANQLIKITEKMNIASSFKKLVTNIKQFLNINTSGELKQAIFISKHHGDVGQVLSPFYPRKMINVEGNKTINTDTFFCMFESYDINPVLKAFSVGLDGIWLHTSPGGGGAPQYIVIFKRRGGIGDDPAVFVNYLKAQVAAEKAKALAYLTQYVAAVGVINATIGRFKELFTNCFATWRQAVADDDTAIRWRTSVVNEPNLNKRYGIILEKASQFAVLSKALPNTELTAYEPADKDIIDAIDPTDGNTQNLKTSLNRITEILEKYKFPKEHLDASQQVFNGGTNDLAKTSIQKDIAVISDASYRSFTKKTMANMWSFINLSGRSRVVSFEPKRIAAYGLKSIHMIKQALDEFDTTYTGLFIEFLKASVSENREIADQLNAGLIMIGIGGAAQVNLRGGKRRTRRKQRGGAPNQLQLQMKRDIQLEVFLELLKDLKIYFTLVLDNLANPHEIHNNLNTFLKDMHGGELDFTPGGNLRGGGEEELTGKFDADDASIALLGAPQAEIFFERDAGQTYDFGMLTPSYAHIKDLISQMCKEFNSAGTKLGIVKKRDTLYDLFYVIQQFALILRLTGEEEKLQEEIKELKEDFDENNYFSECVGWGPALKSVINSDEFLNLKAETFTNITNRLIQKSLNSTVRLLHGAAKEGKLQELVTAEVALGHAEQELKNLQERRPPATAGELQAAQEKVAALQASANTSVRPPVKEYGVLFNNLGKNIKKALITSVATILNTNPSYVAKLKELTYDNPLITWDNIMFYIPDQDTRNGLGLASPIIFNRGQPNVIEFNPFLHKKFAQTYRLAGGGSCRKTQRRHKNENKKRRKTKSKHGRRI